MQRQAVPLILPERPAIGVEVCCSICSMGKGRDGAGRVGGAPCRTSCECRNEIARAMSSAMQWPVWYHPAFASSRSMAPARLPPSISCGAGQKFLATCRYQMLMHKKNVRIRAEGQCHAWEVEAASVHRLHRGYGGKGLQDCSCQMLHERGPFHTESVEGSNGIIRRNSSACAYALLVEHSPLHLTFAKQVQAVVSLPLGSGSGGIDAPRR